MAYTERYVTSAASGGGDGSSGSPWTLAEALTNAAAGDRVNIQSDASYSLGAYAVTNAGSMGSLIVFRGYNSTIGDLEGQGRVSPANGSRLDTTNYPAITLTGKLSTNNYVLFQNLAFTGSLSSDLVGSGSADYWGMFECSVINSANSSSAKALWADNNIHLTQCDFECTAAAHGVVADTDNSNRVAFCRFQGVDTSSELLHIKFGAIIGSLFINGGDGLVYGGSDSDPAIVIGNTFYNNQRAIVFPSNGINSPPMIFNNHVTDCAEFVDNLATGAVSLLEAFNRTRDNTTARTNVGDGMNVGEVTTDTGGAETDFTDAANEDFSLISGAPGEDAGVSIG